jgi:hypothetical protein
MSTSFKSTDKKITEALAKMDLHNIETRYRPPGEVPTYDIEPVVDEKSRHIVNLKLCLMWLMADFGKHIPNSNLPAP